MASGFFACLRQYFDRFARGACYASHNMGCVHNGLLFNVEG